MKISRDNLIVLGILAVISCTYYALVYRWQSSALDDVKARAAERKRDLEADSLAATRVPPMVREIEVMKQRYNKDWDRRLPKRQELAGFLKEIAAGAEDRLANQITRPGRPTRGPLYNCLPITMQFEGTFPALVSFLRRVDGMTRLTRIEQLTIDPKREDGGATSGQAPPLAVMLGMNIYFTEY